MQACQQLKRDMPWSAGHSGNKHQERPHSCQGRAGTREVPWEGRMVMEKEGTLLPFQGKTIKLASPPSFHLLVSPSHLRSLYKISQGAADLLPYLPSTLCQGNVQFRVTSACSCLFTHLCEGDALWGRCFTPSLTMWDPAGKAPPCSSPCLAAQGQNLQQRLSESGIMNSFADRVPGGCMKIPAQVLWGWPCPKNFPGAAAPQ